MDNQSKKTMRHFYCRDALWETFEAMAADFDCSVDYLVNEAMRIYARSKNYQVPSGSSSGSQITTAGPAGPGGSAGTPSGQRNERSERMERPQSATPTPSGATERPTPNTNMGYPPPQQQRPSMGTMPRVNALPPPPPTSGPPTPPTGTPGWGGPATDSPAPPLFLLFQGQRILIDKDQFVLGRGSKTADLAIKDGNISRQHAVVLRRNGVYYIKDLGSTNGIEYKGMRIDNKRIDEGDTFFICDFELRFTYQP